MSKNHKEVMSSDTRMLSRLMFRLLPIQVLLAAIGAVNGIVSSLFASNYVGVSAMSAVALYNPFTQLITAVSLLLVGGSAIICGRYMGQNEEAKMRHVFSLDLVLAGLAALIFTVVLLLLGGLDLTGFFTSDAAVRPIFNMYLLGQAIGVFPLILGNQLSAFLSLENRMRRTTVASLVYIGVNLLLNFLFVQVLQMEAFGLALASSLGLWVFFGIQMQHFLTRDAAFHFSPAHLPLGEIKEILKIGFPSALSNGYQTIRGLIVNGLVTAYVGSVGLSAFGACNNLLSIFWAIPGGMLAVSRLMISVSVGEEDRQTLTDVMRVMYRRFVPLMCIIAAGIMLCAVPLTRMFYRDPSQPVYMMTVWGFRILPLCMPLAIICMHHVCYGQVSGKQVLIHVVSVLDGFISVSFFTAVLIRLIGMNSVYVANVLNGIVSVAAFIIYACIKQGHLPKNMPQLMVIPRSFGVLHTDRMDLSIRSMEEVVSISEKVQRFCLEKGIDKRRAYLAGLAMEEMAGNIVDHGFHKDQKKHSVDVRVVHKDDKIILRLKDDCVPFDPGQRRAMANPEDMTRNIGLRIVFGMATQVEYQSILGMNVLSIHI